MKLLYNINIVNLRQIVQYLHTEGRDDSENHGGKPWLTLSVSIIVIKKYTVLQT